MSLLQPRVLYGLDETFALFPYERGARRSRLVVRARALRALLERGVAEMPTMIGAPFVVGEILEYPKEGQFVPILRTGLQLDALKNKGVAWALRYYRISPFTRDLVTVQGRPEPRRGSLRFEAGAKMVYATHTAVYSVELLLMLTQGTPYEPNPCSSVR